jgi:RNA-directed DNA polymerase
VAVLPNCPLRLGARIAQVVVGTYLEPCVEPIFHQDSYGYLPGRFAHDALGVCRKRCWRNDWVLDVDVGKFLVPSSHCLSVAGSCVKQRGWA